ncbi:GNAT family N-acetyltransferase [Clostridium weizhouense]|uniref:GNAT family N-acetyltransferase n=1 Tax=Clostridium weizhouense TaxID=2859781 RepID=A0ABS7AP64_9CLOT|nr:GNAT family protein [Clostridium weizhouense]MBW6409471.1 GNAT family N-acetyltransferase [Clostridium weizhouense]
MEIYLSNLTRESFKEFFFIKCEKENIYWTNYSDKPNEKKFYKWCEEQLNNKNRQIFIARSINDDIAVGYGYIDFKKDSIEISYAISSKFIGQGLGNDIVRLLVRHCIEKYKEVKEIIAWVFRDNIRSKRCLLRNNFKETGEIKIVYFRANKCITYMLKFNYLPF